MLKRTYKCQWLPDFNLNKNVLFEEFGIKYYPMFMIRDKFYEKHLEMQELRDDN